MTGSILSQKRQIKAIETEYKGYRFRSRLEARYAVLFDALNLDWEYEPEGFDLGDHGWYLPDFFLKMNDLWGPAKDHPGAGYWVEIKAKKPTRQEMQKMIALAAATKHTGYIVCGTPGDGCEIFRFHRTGNSSRSGWLDGLGIGFAVIDCAIDHKKPVSISGATTAARSARFEHGARG